MSIKIQQISKLANRQIIDQHKHWIIILSSSVKTGQWSTVPYGDVIKQRRKDLNRKNDDNGVIEFDLANSKHSHVSHSMLAEDISSFKLLTLARKLVKAHQNFKPRILALTVLGFDKESTERLSEAVIAAVLAASADMPEYKKEKKKLQLTGTLKIYGNRNATAYRRTLAEADGNHLARRLSMQPSNKLTPTDYLKNIKSLARENKWKLEFYGVSELKKKKAGAFLAVVQGSPNADAGIVRLGYQPAKTSRKKIILVGKGICYDTGGTNLKPAKYMYGMHEDMQGSAVALGTFLALSKLNVPFKMECWLALAMNHIGPRAYKPNDVVTACDGTNIEVVHTDAEGRMVLADTLVLASKQKPDLIIDYATLTGACVYSLGTAYSGVFSNREEYLPTLIEAGKDSGERVWPFPLDEDFDEGIKSDIADVKQCALEGNADHIIASRFLKRFVKNDVPWIHVDLASSNRKGGLAHIPTDTTGFGVRFTLNLLLDKKIV